MNKKKLLKQFCGQTADLLKKIIPLAADDKAKADLTSQLASIEKLNTGLSNEDDDGGAEGEGVLTKAFELFRQAHESATQLAARLETAVQQLNGFDARIKAGELLPKDIATEMCAAAGKKAGEEAMQKAKEEFAAKEAAAKRVVDRRTALQTAGLPIPESDAILGEADEIYETARKTAEARTTAYKDKVPTTSKALVCYAWCADKDLPTWEMIIKEIAGKSNGASRMEPLASFGGGAGTTILCAV